MLRVLLFGRLTLRQRRVRAVLLLSWTFAFVWAVTSYSAALAAPGNDGIGIRTVEWLRDNGGAGVVDFVERTWYSWNPPPVGGKPKGGLPSAAVLPPVPGSHANRRTHLKVPPDIQPRTATTLPNEGVWQPAGRPVNGTPSTYVAFLRPDAVHTSLVAGVAWMDTTLLKARLVPGLQEPGGGTDSWGGRIPVGYRPSVVAAFNSAFKLADANGGAYVNGAEVRPLVDGQASLVVHTDGTITVGLWGRDIQMDAGVATVRQNLSLIVDGGSVVPDINSSNPKKWGRTLGNTVFVWRSGVGVDANGGLIYAAGNGLSAATLAHLLAAAGCVRAMELDINSAWVSYYLYSRDGQSPGRKLLGDMAKPAARYFTPGNRDFIAMLPR